MYRVGLVMEGERSREAWNSPNWKLEIVRGRGREIDSRWDSSYHHASAMWPSVGSL